MSEELNIENNFQKIEDHVLYFSLPKKYKSLKPREMANKIEVMIYRLKKKGYWNDKFIRE